MIENTISINSETTENADKQEDVVLQNDGDICVQNITDEDEGVLEEKTVSENDDPFTLTVYGDTVKVSKSEAVSAAQKGIAFENMKQKYFMAKEDPRLKALNNLAQLNGKSISQMLGDMTKEAVIGGLEEKYGQLSDVPETELFEALGQIYNAEKDMNMAADKLLMAEKQSQLAEFLQNNPGCTDIPQQVIEMAREGKNLSLAYSQFQLEQLKSQLEQANNRLKVLESSTAAKAKSMPSAKSAAADSNVKSVYGMMKNLW